MNDLMKVVLASIGIAGVGFLSGMAVQAEYDKRSAKCAKRLMDAAFAIQDVLYESSEKRCKELEKELNKLENKRKF